MAHFLISLETMQSLLAHASAVFTDATLRDTDKALVFSLEEGDSFMGVRNSDLLIRVSFEPLEVKGIGTLQVPFTEVSKILSKLSGLSRTKVSSLELSVEEQRVHFVIHEEGLEEEYAEFAGDTRYTLDSPPIRERFLQELSQPVPEGMEEVSKDGLELVLSSLMPVMDKRKGANANLINFAEDKIFVLDTRGQSFFENILPEVLHNSTLRFSTVAYFRKLLTSTDSLKVGISGKHLSFTSEDGSVVGFTPNLPVRYNYQSTLEGIHKENGLILDRLFLKDVLRRLVLGGNDPLVSLNANGLEISTKEFSRVVPAYGSKGSVEDISFRINPVVFSNMVLGDDNLMSPKLYLYIEPSPRGTGYQLTLSDSTGSFLTNTIVA